MDQLTYGFDRLNLSRRGEVEEWTTIGPRRRLSNPDLGGQSKPDPLIVSPSCAFSIYQIPKPYTEESILTLVNNVTAGGADTKRLFNETTLEVYPKHIVIMRGVPGSGKSSVSMALMATTRKGTICSADDYFKDSKGNYNFNPGRLSDAHRDCQMKCRKLMEKEISPVIIDNTNTRRFELEPYVKMAIENNYVISIFEPETEWKNDARILSQRNIHNVPRGKIQEMIDRFEQINPSTVVLDAKKNMGDVGQRYNPEKIIFGKPVPTPPTPLFGPGSPGKLHPFMTPLVDMRMTPLVDMRMTSPIVRSQSSYSHQGVPRTPMLSEFVMDSFSQSNSKGTYDVEGWDDETGNQYKQSARMAAVFPSGEGMKREEDKRYCLTDQNVSFSAGKLKRRSKIGGQSDSSQSLRSPKVGANTNARMIDAVPEPGPSTKQYSDNIMKSAHILQTYFLTHKIDALADLLEVHNEDIDEAMNALLDSGYSMTEEVIFKDSTVAEASKVENAVQEEVESHVDVPFTSEAASNNAINSVNSSQFTGASMLPETNFTEGGGPNWFNMKVPPEFIKKLALVYGQADDPTIQTMLQSKNGMNAQVPPSLGFDMYRKLIQNAEAKAFKEAEEAAKD